MGLGLAKVISDQLHGPAPTAPNMSQGAALAPAQMAAGSGDSQGYSMPQAHMGAAPQGVGHQALAAVHAGGQYNAGMNGPALPANPQLAGPPAPAAQPQQGLQVRSGLRDLFAGLGNSGQIAAGQAPTHRVLQAGDAGGVPVAQTPNAGTIQYHPQYGALARLV